MPKQPFGFDTPEDSPGFLLWQTTITWQRLIKKALESYDVSHAQFVIMAVLLWLEGQDKAVTQIEIVRMTKLDKMTVSKSLKSLVTSGLVKREEHAEDTRAKTVTLTPKGKTLVSKLVPIVENVDSDFFKDLQKKEQDTLVKILCQLV